jgi:hypothetical protein
VGRSARPAEIARHTVERNGGEYWTSVVDLLSLFGYSELTDHEREEIRDALRAEQVGTDPGVFALETGDQVRLYLLAPQGAFTTSVPAGSEEPASPRRTLMQQLRPQTWKGWSGYAVAAVLIVAAIAGDSDEPQDVRPAAETVEEPAAPTHAAPDARERKAQRAERTRERKQRARIRREQAQARRERAKARRQRAEAKRQRAEARRRRQELEEQSAPPPPEPEATASCHPSYEPCLDPNAGDYDCDGGSGDGPMYTGSVTVTGPDDYDLDRDGDGTGCDS